MSFKRSSKPPARPPPPRSALSLGGMSFKKLEQEEEEDEDDVTISDKYTSLLQQKGSSGEPPTPLLSGSAKSSTSSLPSLAETDDGDKSSPHKKGAKSVFEYKEILSGLKGKIQEKINKKIEDLSGESSASTSPDKELPKELPLLGPLNNGEEAPPSAARSFEEAIAKSSAVKLQSSNPAAAARPTSVSHPKRAGSEERLMCQGAGEKNSFPHSLELRDASPDAHGEEEENILVVEEYFKEEPLEDFTGGLNTSTAARKRSKLHTPLKKKPPKTVATVSMSGLMKSPEPAVRDKQETGNHSSAAVPSSSGIVRMTNASFMRLVSHDGQSVQWTKLVSLVACLFTYFILPLPSYLSGLIAGVVLSIVVRTVCNWLLMPPQLKEPPPLTPVQDLPPMEIPEMKETSLDDGIYRGWMNEIATYNPDDYHINHTFSVFVTLEGSTLRLQRPKSPVPKRAMHDENLASPHFIHQRHFQLKGSRVFLQPPGLVKKRVWSKKYPLCLALAQSGTKTNNAEESSVDPAGQDMGFELVSEEKCDSSVLFLFARTGREKEEWFRRLAAACLGKPLGNAVLDMRRAIDRHRQYRRVNSDGSIRQRHNSTDSQSSDQPEPNATEMEVCDPVLDFTRYMGHLMPAGAFSRLLSPSKAKDSAAKLPFTGSIICDSQLYWLNALIGRCCYDFLRDAWWSTKVKDKLQRKLSKIHVPYFIEELQVTAIDMGKEMPVIRRAANPYLDERGFWVELDVSYGGGFTMTIETKMNLMKLKHTAASSSTSPPSSAAPASERSPVTDSDEEDSAESSTDEEEEAALSPEDKESGSGSKKLLKYLNKLTSSKYFQQATEYKYIKRAMENVSNTPLQLQVTVKHLVGKLAVNVPPPPSDRLWYGFRGAPRLWLVAKPQVGERVVTITHVTDWIERKLEVEFQRVFVMPNMDDLVIPILRASQSGNQADDLLASAS